VACSPKSGEGLRPWIECESPTWDAQAVNRMMRLVARDLAIMGARIEHISGRMGFGDCLRATFTHSRPTEPGILILGHLDTVHPIGTIDRLPFHRKRDVCFGPGILDMKGGIYAALEAIRQLGRTGVEAALPITVLLTSDEEVGSPSTRDLIEAEARRHAYVLVPEPARDDGGVITGRYAIARFNLETLGRPSHAGARPGEGRSALREMARRIIAIEEMTEASCTFGVGVIESGRWVMLQPWSLWRAAARSRTTMTAVSRMPSAGSPASRSDSLIGGHKFPDPRLIIPCYGCDNSLFRTVGNSASNILKSLCFMGRICGQWRQIPPIFPVLSLLTGNSSLRRVRHRLRPPPSNLLISLLNLFFRAELELVPQFPRVR